MLYDLSVNLIDGIASEIQEERTLTKKKKKIKKKTATRQLHSYMMEVEDADVELLRDERDEVHGKLIA